MCWGGTNAAAQGQHGFKGGGGKELMLQPRVGMDSSTKWVWSPARGEGVEKGVEVLMNQD